MSLLSDFKLLIAISHSHDIARRYFVTNGFDGALAMLGLTMGFYVGDSTAQATVLSACVGVAIALMMSGFSSAYISEMAERRRELKELEEAMISDLDASAHARAARLIPWVIAVVNGLSPFLIAMLIIAPLWLGVLGIELPLPPLQCAIVIAFGVIFLLGVYLGRVSGTFWLWSSLRTLTVAGVTAFLILCFNV